MDKDSDAISDDNDIDDMSLDIHRVFWRMKSEGTDTQINPENIQRTLTALQHIQREHKYSNCTDTQKEHLPRYFLIAHVLYIYRIELED